MAKKKAKPVLLSDSAQKLAEDASIPLAERARAILMETIEPPEVEPDPLTLAAENRLYEFIKQAWPVVEPVNQYVDGWHLGCVAEHLQAVTALQIRNLLISQPPRHTKSLSAAVFWFCWAWIKNPGSRWLYASYSASLSTGDSKKCRHLIASNWYQQRWGHKFQVRENEDTAVKFVNDKAGYRLATSVGGAGAGLGADVICGDDLNDIKEANSPSKLERAINFWDHTMSSRGNDPKTLCKVVIAQRIKENDVIGHITAANRGYEYLVLPAEYEPHRYWFPPNDGSELKPPRDAIVPTVLQQQNPALLDAPCGSGRADDGDLLWPERFDHATLAALKAELRSFGVAGQLQQRPNPAEGSIFQQSSFRYFAEETTRHGLRLILGVHEEGMPPPPTYYAAECRWFQTIDTALTAKSQSAWTVVGTFVRTPDGHLLVWDIWRERVLVPQQYEAIMQLKQGRGLYDVGRRTWSVPGKLRPWPVEILYQAVESKASGIGLIQQSVQDGHPFRVLKADVDKVRRSATLATMFEAGLVFFREAATSTWLVDFEQELLSFPSGAYDDSCVAKGSLIETESGLCPVEQIKSGVLVQTRSGLRRVKWSGQTGKDATVLRLETFCGRRLEATGNHPVFVVGKGYVPLDAVKYGDKILVWQPKVPSVELIEKASGLTDLSLAVTQTRNYGTFASISGLSVETEDLKSCTGKCGNLYMEKFHTDALFITKMKTHSTILPRILSVSQVMSIRKFMLSLSGIVKKLKNILRKFVRWPLFGTNHQKGGSGTENQILAGFTEKDINSFVNGAKKNSRRLDQKENSVQQPAWRPTEGDLVSTTKIASAVFADAVSRQTDTVSSLFVAVVAQVGLVEKRTDVFNLEVEDAHEYFANGILVHNCDVTSYAATLCTQDALTTTQVKGDLLVDGGGHSSLDEIVAATGDVSRVGDLMIDWEANHSWWLKESS